MFLFPTASMHILEGKYHDGESLKRVGRITG